MHSDPLSKELKEHEEEFNAPLQTFVESLYDNVQSVKEIEELNHKIEDLEALNETLEQRIAGRDETIAYLRLPWYRKLWMKLPRIAIYWKETV